MFLNNAVPVLLSANAALDDPVFVLNSRFVPSVLMTTSFATESDDNWPAPVETPNRARVTPLDAICIVGRSVPSR